jgi:glyoxylase-like metal-dependent hydrolase (beta-lactamase superfamily II)/molybdopterin-guanine dinucleotide biosynthesis protein A
VVVLAPGAPRFDVPAPARAAHDEGEGEGPLAGLRAGLAAVAASDVAIVAAGDMPDLQPVVLRAMLRTVTADPTVDVVALRDGERARPLPLAVRTQPTAAAARRLLDRDDRRLRSLLRELRTRELDDATWTALDPERRTLRDVDEPGDLANHRSSPVPSEEAVRVGSFEVVPLLDGWAPLPLGEELPGHSVDWDAERRRVPWVFASRDAWAWHVRAFLVRDGERVFLIDTGIGHLGTERHPVAGRIDASLAAIGCATGTVRHVIHTHLHADHAGGACMPDGSPRFPNAVHHVHEADWRFFARPQDDGSAGAEADDVEGRAAIRGLEERGQLSVTAADGTIADGVRVVHTPGHTPGHRSVVVADGDEAMLFTGDLLHLPIQVSHPEWPSSHDVDPMLGVGSRRMLLFRARRRGWRLAVTHFGRPFGRVGDDGWIEFPPDRSDAR